jgi:hypothetical protein
MKPCIDGVEPLLGHPDNLLSEPRESPRRRLAPQDEMVLSLAFHVRGGDADAASVLILPFKTSTIGRRQSLAVLIHLTGSYHGVEQHRPSGDYVGAPSIWQLPVGPLRTQFPFINRAAAACGVPP